MRSSFSFVGFQFLVLSRRGFVAGFSIVKKTVKHQNPPRRTSQGTPFVSAKEQNDNSHIPGSTGSYCSRLLSSYSADGSEYSSTSKDDFENDNEAAARDFGAGYRDDDEDATPTVELQPVPMSKNSGNKFISFLWDNELDTEGRDALDLHYDRAKLTEDHVMFCRKNNLYNETFNAESMVDIPFSLPMYVYVEFDYWGL